MSDGTSFTGVRRSRKTRFSVKLGDIVSRLCITIGGIGTIIAVIGVAVFLVAVTLPMFAPGSTGAGDTPLQVQATEPQRIVVDEYRHLAWSCDDQGQIRFFRIDDGANLGTFDLGDERVPTSLAFSVDGRCIAAGYDDGTVRLTVVAYETEIVDREKVDESVGNIGIDEIRFHEGALYTVTPKDQLRVQRLKVTPLEPMEANPGQAVVSVAVTLTLRYVEIATIHADGSARMVRSRYDSDLYNNRDVLELSGRLRDYDIPLAPPEGKGLPDHIQLNIHGSHLYCIWTDGTYQRYSLQTKSDIYLTDDTATDLLPESDRTVTAVSLLLGGSTILVGDSKGDIGAWFTVKPSGSKVQDGTETVRGHHLHGIGSPVRSMATSVRKRMFIAGHEDGTVEIHHVTAENHVASTSMDGGQAIEAVAIMPKDDGFLAAAGGAIQTWRLSAQHPDISFKALFGRVWYENNEKPAHVWQTSSGSDDAEPKYGLMPLVFGTIKATVYSLIFGVPIAILAAVYTSEFLHPSWKARIKPAVELMASLPSVVLGFLAGIVFAPVVDDVLPAFLSMIFIVPFTLLACAYLWQLLPQRFALRWADHRIWAMIASVILGIVLSFVIGPLVIEDLLFSGDVKRWLHDLEFGSPRSGWMLVTLPISAIVVMIASSRLFNDQFATMTAGFTRQGLAFADLIKFVILSVIVVILAWILAFLGASLLELRFSNAAELSGGIEDPLLNSTFLFGTYISRNAMVVGFAMGFAIIPIIYTIAEDALSTVPEHLRGASLGAGATPWQTAQRIIIPTAMSGLFSAVMVGLGRAVGETMIVLMAAGNTPILDWNPFTGFQTLAAAIATEMPEAPKDTTHYRTLFVAALTLFIMTFVLNTIAESVRQRFRKRAFQL